MNRLLFVTCVWVLSVLIHPFIWLGWFALENNSSMFDNFTETLAVGAFLSIPTYIICLFFSNAALHNSQPARAALRWMLLVSASVFLPMQLMGLFFTGDLASTIDFAVLCLPAFIASVFATAILYKQFLLTINPTENNVAI